ncbi:hypothetical protein QR77_41415 [Streptomyces sp. 150FB]|uniref:hypothetical protein n=1 Tax=Streptomyces sp. 150FB TaxID=1576605 RepID=UPI000589065D|nr:hypothetical protein [Streptomyces sp. 150FB]KIF72745.1 hypothetical protein QR77_41415 [Streptomyces sp. 150FB]
MIRLPSTHAAITTPLVASNAAFPGIPIGKSLLDGRAFHLSPVLTDAAILPSTNSLALGGLGSGKSTTAKTRIRREILHHQHQAVVIDSFGEDNAGEWAPLVRSLGGRVIQAGTFTLNPCSELFPPAVREQLIRSLILAVEPGALTYQATHALQHALNHPKATSLNGVVDALVSPEDGRWPAVKLAEWGEGAALALSRYTEGSLRGLFDGQEARLPETDLPILSFDFTGLDRNSPAIPSLMAAVSCWAEHVWLPQSTAVHRHLVIEEAWQILLSPATSELIQRLLKNSRKAGLSLDVVMHTLSDLGDGRAQDLARLCEVAHVGRLGPEEAAIVGALLGLPVWAIDMIPTLDPGQAVWKVGPDHVDIIQTILTDDEATLTDTSSRRRTAQQALSLEAETEREDEGPVDLEEEPADDQHKDQWEGLPAPVEQESLSTGSGEGENGWDWELPPNVIDIDTRHHDVVQAATEGRCSEAADLAAIGERSDITAHGINSPQAASWLSTRAHVADVCGNPEQATQLRATVIRMRKETGMGDNPDWFATSNNGQQWYSGPQPAPVPAAPPAPAPNHLGDPSPRRRTWPYVAAVAALSLATAGVVHHTHDEQQQQERAEKALAYKGRAGAALHVDGVHAYAIAQWSTGRDHVTLELRSYFDRNAQYLRIDADGKTASSVQKDGWYPLTPEVTLPVTDPLADVTVQVAVGGKTWQKGSPGIVRTIRLSPTGISYDAETGHQLPSDL